MLCAVVAYGKISLFEGNNNLVLTLTGKPIRQICWLFKADWRTYLLTSSNHRFDLLKLVSLILVDDEDDDDDYYDYYYNYYLYDQT